MLAGFINLGQNIVGKFTKINIGFSMECFTTDFLQLSSATVKNGLAAVRLGKAKNSQLFLQNSPS